MALDRNRSIIYRKMMVEFPTRAFSLASPSEKRDDKFSNRRIRKRRKVRNGTFDRGISIRSNRTNDEYTPVQFVCKRIRVNVKSGGGDTKKERHDGKGSALEARSFVVRGSTPVGAERASGESPPRAV